MKKIILTAFLFASLLSFGQVPQRFNKVIATGDITSPKFIKTGSTADSVLLGNGSARSISAIKTDTVSLSNRINAKAAGSGTANGTNTGDETLTSIKTKLGAATSVSDGYLKYQDFVRFDGKQPAGAYLTAEVDGSTTNELNSSSAWDNATNTISVTDAGGTKSAVITGFLESEVDGSVTNELQTISTNGAAGNITLSNSGGTLNLNVNDADASATNEIQDLSLSGNTLTLSSDATTVDISQSTAVLANTAKVSNATHTGDVTGSTALTLATVNSNVGTFNNVTINAKGLATAGSNVSYEPSFSKNTAFNKNFGTTAGTVLEGRTFGTAANSAVGDFQPIENQRLSTANSPLFASSTLGYLEIQNSGVYPVVGLTQSSNYLVAKMGSNGFILRDPTNNIDAIRSNIYGDVSFSATSKATSFIGVDELTGSALNNYFELHRNGTLGGCRMQANRNTSLGGVGFKFAVTTSNSDELLGIYTTAMEIDRTTAATFHSTVNSTGFLLNGNNLTSSLSTNYLPKWNGSNFVNATAGTDYQKPITLTTNGTSGAATFSGNVLNVPNYAASGGVNQTQTTVNGSTGGNMVCSMPFQTGSYKKVMIRFSSLSGNASYSYPTVFTTQPSISSIYQQVGTPGTYTTGGAGASAFTITGASGLSGWIIIEGY